jgi:hypothetical protein
MCDVSSAKVTPGEELELESKWFEEVLFRGPEWLMQWSSFQKCFHGVIRTSENVKDKRVNRRRVGIFKSGRREQNIRSVTISTKLLKR